MNLLRWSAIASLIGLFAVLLSGCVVPDGGYYGDAGIGADYYEPYGADYGDWGPGYQVGPFRGGGQHPDRGHGQHPGQGHGQHPDQGGDRLHQPPYRPAPASEPIPSIPLRQNPWNKRAD